MLKRKTVKAIILVVIMLAALFLLSSCGNRSMGIDPYQTAKRAWINLGGEWKLVTVESWRDYNDSDEVQIVVDGVPYWTSYVNVVMIGK